MEPQEQWKAWGKVVARAWSDELFKKRLLADPAAVLKENGIEVPPDVTPKIVEDSAKVAHLILPERPGDLSVEDLDLVAGGRIRQWCCGLCSSWCGGGSDCSGGGIRG